MTEDDAWHNIYTLDLTCVCESSNLKAQCARRQWTIESATVAHSTLTNGKESSSTYGLSRCEWGPSIISDVDGTRMGK